MRKLLYIPIIHSSADLGSVADEIDKKGRALCGEKRWKAHQQTIALFWETASEFFDKLNPKGFKIYQDGLVAEGERGMKIVEEGVKRGSKNYEIIQQLIDKGASLRKTEGVEAVLEEYKSVVKLTQTKSFLARIMVFIKYRFNKKRILEARDNYVAKRIKADLQEEETGILFMGAQHEIIERLPLNIEVIELKDRKKILTYLKGYYFRSRQTEMDKLAQYLKAPIEVK